MTTSSFYGFFHSFLAGTLLAFLLAATMSKLRSSLSPLMSFLKLEQKLSFKSILSAALFSVYLHILLDSPLYSDIRPFYPFDFNPFLSNSMFIGFEVYTLCVLSFIGGAVIYAIRLVFRRRTAVNRPRSFKPFESRIVSEDELTGYLDEGWDLVKELSNGKIVIRRALEG